MLERRQDVVTAPQGMKSCCSLRLVGLVFFLFVGQVQVHVVQAFSYVPPTPHRFRGWGILDTSDVTTRPKTSSSTSTIRNSLLYTSRSSSSSNIESENEEQEIKYQRLMDWLFQEEECEGEGSVQVKCCPLTGTRGLYAREDFQEGDCLFAIPLDAALVVEDVETSDAERGSKLLTLLQQQQQRQQQHHETQEDDRWRSYFNVLPTMKEMHFHPTPDFWTEDEILALEFPRLVNAALERKERIQSLAAKQKNGRDGKMNVEELQYATWLVESRSLTLVGEPYPDCPEDELQTTSVLIPLLDMINHSSSNPNVELDVLQSDDDDDDDDDDDQSFYAVIATEDIPKGTELFISYGTGEESSVELLQYYGFVPSSNPHDINMLQYGNDEDEDDDDDCLLNEDEWTTSLEDDEQALDAGVVGVEKTILQFRIRMKQALREWDNEE